MRRRPLSSAITCLVSLGVLLCCQMLLAAPLALHPENPHYFVFRGKPTVFVTSGEHYGAVLNLDFDFTKYLDELAAHGLNGTRTFTGVYVEDEKAFNIAENTLAPKSGRLICPWARSDQAGYLGGGAKFDLSRWDDAYFRRLREFLAAASKRGVIVELALFCPFYEDSMWRLSPQNGVNNVNNLGNVARTDVYTLDKNGGLLAIQDALVKKIVAEVNEFDNLLFEVCNEPYFGGVTMDWQRHIAEVIQDAEKTLANKHLISMNIANGSARVSDPVAGVSVFNFHYANPPDAVAENYALNKPIGDNETGFKGTADTHYRREAWEFLLAGGALYNNLDYSFTAGHEDGTFEYPPSQPGGGNRGFRKQMQTLKKFVESFDFVRMKPDKSFIHGGVPAGAAVQALAEPGNQYAIYVIGGQQANLQLDLPAGNYDVQWLDPPSGEIKRSQQLKHAGGEAKLESPGYDPDIALRIKRR